MMNLYRWQTGPALVITLGMATSAIAPLATPASAASAPYTVAQLFPSQGGYADGRTIPSGTRIPVRQDDGNKIVVSPDETSNTTLKVSRNIRNTAGTLLIPAGSEIRGRIEPAGDGSRFVAETLTLRDGTSYPISAESRVISRREEVSRTNGTAIATGAVVGAGAAALLSGVLGNRRIKFGRVLAGAGAGALGGLLLGKKRQEVIVINPDPDLTLILNSDLALR